MQAEKAACDAHEPPSKAINKLKVRDDHRPVHFRLVEQGKFEFCEADEAQFSAQGFGFKELRSRIEPWLTALFQSEHLSLLVGSGLSHAVHSMAAGKSALSMAGVVSQGRFKGKIQAAADASARAAGREQSNIEDQIRVANELLRGLEIFGAERQADALRDDLTKTLRNFAHAILKAESSIATAASADREMAFNRLVAFLMSFASRTGTRERLNIYTTNYDRLIEAGAELAGLHLLDRFLGNLTPIFRSSRLDVDMHYNPPGIRGEPRYLEGVARFTKLHGSVDWVQSGKDIRRVGLPFGVDKIDPYLAAPGLRAASTNQMMIFPNAAKDRETLAYPYVELFRDLAAVVCRPNSTLVTYGYGFGDEHINRVIHDMLTIPSTHLVVISMGDNLGRIEPLAEEKRSQVSLLLGPQLADLASLTDWYLPKAAIDRATIRMSDLLKQRHGLQPQADDSSDGTPQKQQGTAG